MSVAFDSTPLRALEQEREGNPIGWNLPRDFVSASQLGMFLRCPEQYRRRYLLGEKLPPKGFLVWGSADHRALEHNWRQKIESHQDLPVRDVQEAFAAELDAVIEQDQEAAGQEIDWEKSSRADVLDAGTQLVAAYHLKASPKVQPVQVEQKFSIQVPGVPVDVIGYIDLETDGPIIDRKTAGRKTLNVPGNYRLQGSIYMMARQRPVDFHYSIKTKTPQIILPDEAPGLSLALNAKSLKLSEERVRRTVRLLSMTYDEFGPDQPWPDAMYHDPCSWCGFRPVCPHWGNG